MPTESLNISNIVSVTLPQEGDLYGDKSDLNPSDFPQMDRPQASLPIPIIPIGKREKYLKYTNDQFYQEQ
jgi:hypothetical protein